MEFDDSLPQLTIKELRNLSGMTQEQFSDYFMIPINTIKKWESSSDRECKPYIIELIEHQLTNDGLIDYDKASIMKIEKYQEKQKIREEKVAKIKAEKKKKEEKHQEKVNDTLKRISNLVETLSMSEVTDAIENTMNERDIALYKALRNYMFMNVRRPMNTIAVIKKMT